MKCLNLKSYINCFVFVKCVVDYELTPFLTFFLGSWGVNVLIPEQQINQWWSHFLSGRGSFQYKIVVDTVKFWTDFSLRRMTCFQDQVHWRGSFVCLKKKKCKGQVNNLRISYTFLLEKSIFYLCAISS